MMELVAAPRSPRQPQGISSIPWAVRHLAALGSRPRARPATLRLARTLLEPAKSYRGGHGLALKIDPRDRFQQMMLLGWYDPVLIAMLRHFARPGQVVIDAGGYIGYVTVQLAQAVGPSGEVHTFECDPRLVDRIRENVRINDITRVRVNELAVYDRSGDALTLQLTDQLGWSTVQLGVWEAPRTVKVSTVAIDDYVVDAGIDPRRIGVIKLDVEGSEMKAVEGMLGTLTRASAAVIVEFQPWRVEHGGRRPSELIGLLRDCGYEPWAPRKVARGAFGLVPGTEPEVGEDILFLPG